MLFTAFAAYTGVLVYREGDADCGCFALWSPRSTVIFLVDCGIAAGLLAMLRGRMVAPTGRRQTGPALLTASAVPPLLAGALSLPQTGITELPTGELYLDPTRWVGQKLPPAGVVDGITELSHRPRCLLLFVSHDSPLSGKRRRRKCCIPDILPHRLRTCRLR
ncbi:MAG: hypothetical protein KatS3mg027_0018 [Bacteroidia bacterium]|nr:MAG: hypothetical protein KatS3mg027_0018 [Bacteroidia bacterium]